MGEKYRIMSDENVKKGKEWTKETVKNWHDKIKPEVIFLAECSATPTGYALKEAWRNMYPGEKMLDFIG